MNHKNLSYYLSFFETPALWHGELDGLKQFEFPRIDFVDLKTEAIPFNLRFGHKIEHIFLQLLQHSQDYRVIAHNIPIRKDKVSLGEIDFVLQHTENKSHVHIELTYKFYVVRKDTTIVEQLLIGPNQRDSFYAKKEKIKNRQIPLLNTPIAISVLKEYNLDTSKLQHRVCFKSQLFIPYDLERVNLFPFNSACIVGRWISLAKFKTSKFLDFVYYVPTKSEWLLRPHNEVVWSTHIEVLDHITSKLEEKYSPMLWVKTKDFKIEKLFVLWW